MGRELETFYKDNINYFLDMVFEQADKDQDGVVDRTEFKRFITEMHQEQSRKKMLTDPWKEIQKFRPQERVVDPIWASKKIQQKIDDMDENKDGVVTRDEFIEFWRKVGVRALPRNYASHPWAHASDHLVVGVQAAIRDALIRMAWKNADTDNDGYTSRDEACRALAIVGINPNPHEFPETVDYHLFKDFTIGFCNKW